VSDLNWNRYVWWYLIDRSVSSYPSATVCLVLITVKPAPLSLLRVINSTSSSLMVVWTKPEYISPEFLVRLNYTSLCTNSSMVNLQLTLLLFFQLVCLTTMIHFPTNSGGIFWSIRWRGLLVFGRSQLENLGCLWRRPGQHLFPAAHLSFNPETQLYSAASELLWWDPTGWWPLEFDICLMSNFSSSHPWELPPKGKICNLLFRQRYHEVVRC